METPTIRRTATSGYSADELEAALALVRERSSSTVLVSPEAEPQVIVWVFACTICPGLMLACTNIARLGSLYLLRGDAIALGQSGG